MVHPTQQELDAFARLARSPDGIRLQDYLNVELQKMLQTLMQAPVEQVQRMQGRSQGYNDVLQLLKGCKEAFEKQQSKPSLS